MSCIMFLSKITTDGVRVNQSLLLQVPQDDHGVQLTIRDPNGRYVIDAPSGDLDDEELWPVTGEEEIMVHKLAGTVTFSAKKRKF